MGFGDIKLVGAIGAFLGWKAALFAIVSSAFFGTLIALPLMVAGRKKLLDRLPYGPYLALGALTWMFWGPRIIDFYISMLRVPA